MTFDYFSWSQFDLELHSAALRAGFPRIRRCRAHPNLDKGAMLDDHNRSLSLWHGEESAVCPDRYPIIAHRFDCSGITACLLKSAFMLCTPTFSEIKTGKLCLVASVTARVLRARLFGAWCAIAALSAEHNRLCNKAYCSYKASAIRSNGNTLTCDKDARMGTYQVSVIKCLYTSNDAVIKRARCHRINASMLKAGTHNKWQTEILCWNVI